VTKTTAVTIVVLVLMAGAIVYTSVGLNTQQCEICITFEGRQACRTVEAATEAEARMGAITNVCALISSGVTDSMRCSRTEPTRESCGAVR
jgi:hypothetical protein